MTVTEERQKARLGQLKKAGPLPKTRGYAHIHAAPMLSFQSNTPLQDLPPVPSATARVGRLARLVNWLRGRDPVHFHAEVQAEVEKYRRAEKAIRESQELLDAIIDHSAAVINETRRSESRQLAHLERLNLLDQITSAIGERQDLRSIFQVAVGSLEDHMPVDFSCICTYDAVRGLLTLSQMGARSITLAAGMGMDRQFGILVELNGLSRCVAGTLMHEPDIRYSAFPFPRRLAAGGLGSLVLAPLVSEQRVFGVLLAARRGTSAFSSADCEFLRQLSSHVALAAYQARLYEDLRTAYDDLRQTQQAVLQQERLRALGQMAGGIAHDINNAISPVAIYTETLLENEPGLSDRARSYLEIISRAIGDVAATVSRMREFSREREPQAALTAVGLNQMVQQVIDHTHARWSDMAQQRGAAIDLRTDLASALPDVMGIESEIREALVNLVFNSLDAMPEGGKLVLRTRVETALAGAKAGTHASVRLDVIDTGAGMSEEVRRRCVEPFFTTKGERGTGLGLAMVYGVAQRHDARVEIESSPGAGTMVSLCFPLPEVAPKRAGDAARQSRPVAPQRILVVDDDPMLLRSLCESLRADGHSVTGAAGGQAGIGAFHSALHNHAAGVPGAHPFDVVMTDLGMPHVGGREVAREVKAASPGTPVILLTGWGQHLSDSGENPPHIDHVLGKPPRIVELRAVLAQVGEKPALPHLQRSIS